MIDENFVLKKVGGLFANFAKENGALSPPVDPSKLARLCGVLDIEYRRMVPEGVLAPVKGGFAIYLQNNFRAWNRKKTRERFSLAHELAHTFFYDQNHPVPKPMKGAPRGGRLEHLCHLAAGEILLPSPLLKQELKRKGMVASADAMLGLAELFDVSLEALMRRLHESRLFEEERFAAILVDTLGSKQTIRAACYGPVLICNAPKPERGADFGSWVLPLLPTPDCIRDGGWTHNTKTAVISAKRIVRSPRSFVLDLQFGPPIQHLTA
jgi:hypothetical protein